MKVALYARVSSNKCDVCGQKKLAHGAASGHEFRGQNPEVQLGALRQWAKGNGNTISGEFVDRLKGAEVRRPQLEAMIHSCTAGLGNIEAIAVQRLDRFGRSVIELHGLVEKLRKVSVKFVSITEGFDLTTPAGEALFGMLCVFAQFERRMISERTKSGMAQARAEGKPIGRRIDPKRGPSRTTRWRRRNLAKSA